jgi:peptidoglycan/LPS O-acetylase OafA/YrhL
MTKESTSSENSSLASHQNNLDFLRLFFALAVLVTHSYALTGVAENDLLSQFSHDQARFSHTGVQGFLIISGFLISKSLVRSSSLPDYYFKRALRVFPGLFVTVCLTVVLCAFLSDKPILSYFAHYSTRDYIIYNSLLKIQYGLMGVFVNNPYPKAVNGSLWTIPYEVFFYVLLSLCYFIRQRVNILRALFIGCFLVATGLFIVAAPELSKFSLPFWELQGHHIMELAAFFLAGAIWAVFPLPSDAYRKKMILFGLPLLIISLYLGGYVLVQFLALPILVIAFGTLNSPKLSFARKFGDFSYGIYLWGFVVQQTLVHLFHLNQMQLMLTSIPLTYVCGALSWHLIEKHALRLKMRPLPLRA